MFTEKIKKIYIIVKSSRHTPRFVQNLKFKQHSYTYGVEGGETNKNIKQNKSHSVTRRQILYDALCALATLVRVLASVY